MPLRLLTVLSACCSLLPLATYAQAPARLRYHWSAGQTLQYLVMRNPYYADPSAAMETTDPNAPYRPPLVQRLTEQVLSVEPNGTAALRLTLGPEPGFDDDVLPAPPMMQTVTVTPTGLIAAGAFPGMPPDLLAAIVRLPSNPVPERGGLAVLTQDLTGSVTQQTSPSHDGTLLQTTRCHKSDRAVFDARTGSLLRRVSTVTGTLSLVMIRPAKRGAADFGHVIPTLPIVQTLTVERKEDVSPLPHGPPTPALTAPY